MPLEAIHNCHGHMDGQAENVVRAQLSYDLGHNACSVQLLTVRRAESRCRASERAHAQEHPDDGSTSRHLRHDLGLCWHGLTGTIGVCGGM